MNFFSPSNINENKLKKRKLFHTLMRKLNLVMSDAFASNESLNGE